MLDQRAHLRGLEFGEETDVAGGMEIEARLGEHKLLLARTGEQPFVTRLVRKFGLPVDGWRGAAERDATHAR